MISVFCAFYNINLKIEYSSSRCRFRHGDTSKPIYFSFEVILVNRKLFFVCSGLVISLDLSTKCISF